MCDIAPAHHHRRVGRLTHISHADELNHVEMTFQVFPSQLDFKNICSSPIHVSCPPSASQLDIFKSHKGQPNQWQWLSIQLGCHWHDKERSERRKTGWLRLPLSKQQHTMAWASGITMKKKTKWSLMKKMRKTSLFLPSFVLLRDCCCCFGVQSDVLGSRKRSLGCFCYFQREREMVWDERILEKGGKGRHRPSFNVDKRNKSFNLLICFLRRPNNGERTHCRIGSRAEIGSRTHHTQCESEKSLNWSFTFHNLYTHTRLSALARKKTALKLSMKRKKKRKRKSKAQNGIRNVFPISQFAWFCF